VATYVLIHGAFQGGWVWKRVASHLRAAGHVVYAPTLDGCAERNYLLRPGITVDTHATEIAQMLYFEDLRDVVLASTSIGGMVMCKAAELARDRIARLVFIDALALSPGEKIDDLQSRAVVREETGVSLALPTVGAEHIFADIDAETLAWARPRFTPQPTATISAPMVPTTFWEHTWDASVIWCRKSFNPPGSHQRRTAERLKAKWSELDAGHYPMLTHPAELAALVIK
jgi:pimeloyl-ACP methyl ester carboxylesterase